MDVEDLELAAHAFASAFDRMRDADRDVVAISAREDDEDPEYLAVIAEEAAAEQRAARQDLEVKARALRAAWVDVEATLTEAGL